MTRDPSGFKRAPDVQLRFRRMPDGRIVVENAYEGNYQYFPQRDVVAAEGPFEVELGSTASDGDRDSDP